MLNSEWHHISPFALYRATHTAMELVYIVLGLKLRPRLNYKAGLPAHGERSIVMVSNGPA